MRRFEHDLRDVRRPAAINRRAFVGGSLALAGLPLSSADVLAQTKSATPKRGGILRVSAYLNPSSLDPITGRSGVDPTYLYALYDTLIDFEPETLKPRPGLAKWTFPDPKTMVFEINPGIVFHDGTPCDAEAVKAHFDRAMTAKRSVVKPELANIVRVEVTGPLGVVLHLKEADTALPLALADRPGMICSPKAVAEAGDDFDRRPCGTGQFKFVSWSDGDRIIVTRNESYWKKGFPYLDGITFRVITDFATSARSVQAGESDYTWLVPSHLYETLRRNKDVSVVRFPSVRTVHINFNYSRGPLMDKRVRQAINYALDRVGFVRATTDGTGDVASSFAPKEHWSYDKDGEARYPYDPDKARALLKEAGLMTVELGMIVLPNAEYRKRAEIIIENLKKVGINVTMIPAQQTVATYVGEMKGDMFMTAWPGRPDMTSTYSLIFSKNGYYNVGSATPVPEMDALIEATRSVDAIPERAAAFKKLMQAEREAALFAPICSEQILYATRATVKGFKPDLLGKPKFDGVYLES